MRVNRKRYLSGLMLAGAFISFPVLALADPAADPVKEDETVVVTGSLLPGTGKDTASPVIVITSEEMQKKGFGEVFDALRGQAIVTGAMRDSAPGTGNMQNVKMINLFGLGASYTKVLINGRSTANFPLNNNVGDGGNFANLSTIPTAMVERIEILPGTQSATYGADAVAGVVNIILKKNIDKLALSVRGSGYDEGGGESIRVQAVGGLKLPSDGSLSYAFEFSNRKAILGIDRDRTAYSPYDDDAFARISGSNYYDPGVAGCAQMSDLFGGSMTYKVDGAMRYCGSDYTRSSVATYDSERRNYSGYASLSQPVADGHELYMDLSGTYSRTISNFGPVFVWENFTDTNSGRSYLVSREIAPEEMGSWKTSAKRDYGTQYDIALGLKGAITGNWNYDVSGSRSFYKLKQKTFYPVKTEMTAYLADRYSDISQVFVPLTPEEYAGFSDTRRRNASSRVQQLTGKVYNSSLFDLPGGSAAFALLAEAGNESWKDTPSADFQAGLYFDGAQLASRGKRDHSGVATEVSLPLLPWVSISGAARYDDYSYAGKSVDRATWKAGLEIRPMPTLLLRAGMGTAFRVPDMSYLFLGKSSTNSNSYDLYMCDQMGVSRTSNSCRYIMPNESTGNLALKPVTAKSKTLGAVWTPTPALRFSADFIDINIKNEVRALTLANILFDEAACRQGGEAVYLGSCSQALSLITRDGVTGRVTGVTRGYFNVSTKKTQSLILAGQYQFPVQGIGQFRFDINYNRVLEFKSQNDSVSPVVDQLKNPSAGGLFKDSMNTSLSLDSGPFSTTVYAVRYGKSPNYALLTGGPASTSYGMPGWDKAWTLFNLSASYDIGSGFAVNGTVNNLFNRMPPSKNWDSQPYYNAALYNVYGRGFSLELTKSF
ncbi:MAG: hypothetical protein E2598_03715 [Sphingobium sp.]|nr:hypothetical protein [Sphingobium sp.]